MTFKSSSWSESIRQTKLSRHQNFNIGAITILDPSVRSNCHEMCPKSINDVEETVLYFRTSKHRFFLDDKEKDPAFIQIFSGI